MAKKNDENKDSFFSKLGSFFMILIIILIWLVIIAALIKLDVGGLGSGVLRPLLKDVPVLNLILPDVDSDQIAEENDYAYKDLEKANQAIKELQETVDKLYEENDDYAQRQAELADQIKRLQQFEEQQEEFEKRLKEFDRLVVYNEKVSVEEFIKFYESMHPENAKSIYEELTASSVYSEYIKERAKYFQKMDAADAAKILSEMINGDLEDVCRILKCMKANEVANILAEMEPLDGARINRRMNDMDSAVFYNSSK